MKETEKAQKLKEAKKRKNNMRLYPYYTIFGYDLLFYYSIYVLFLSEVKQVSDADIVFLSSIYAISAVFVMLTISAIISKIGTRKALIYGDFINILSTLMLIIGNTYTAFIIAELLSAIAFGFKNVATSPMLRESIPHTKKRGKLFSKIDSNGYSKYCIFAAISTIASGYLYNIDPYIPMFLCMLCSVISFIIASKFEQIKKDYKEMNTKKSLKQIKEVLVFTIKSKRLKALLISLGFMWGILSLMTTYGTTLLKNIGISAEYISIIFALQEIFKGMFSKRANLFHEKNRNNTITKILYIISLSYVLAGIMSIIKVPFMIQIASLIVLFSIIKGMQGIYNILYKKYLNNFMTSRVLPSVYSMQTINDNIFRTLITTVGAGLLNMMDIKYATLLMGILFVVLTSVISGYMKDKVGLKPEEYGEIDLKYAHKK